MHCGDRPTALREFPATRPKFWTQMSGPLGGDGIAISEKFDWLCVPSDAGRWRFRSTDNAETWTGINNGLTATNVRALAVSPVDYI